MTTMVRCLEGHAFDMDASATCPECGSPVWRDAVKEAAEKAAREAREAKAAKEAKAAAAAEEAKVAREAANRAAQAKEAAAVAAQTSASATDVEGNDVVARASRAARAAREAKATGRSEPAEGRDASLKSDRVAEQTAAKTPVTKQDPPLWFVISACIVGTLVLLYMIITGIVPMGDVYAEYRRKQPSNTAIENVVYTTVLEFRHSLRARPSDVGYGSDATRNGRK